MDGQRFHASLAWLGGESLVSDVTFHVREGTISSIERGAGPRDATRLEGITLPGLVSAHSHAFHRVLRGKTHSSGGDFWTWRRLMYRVANRLDPEVYRLLSAGVFSEMLAAGITKVGEFHYVHHRSDGKPYADPNAMGMALIGAAADTGIGLTLIDACYVAGDVDGSPPSPEQRRFSDGSVAAWAERVRALVAQAGPPVTIGVAAHSVRAVPASDLPTVADLAAELELPVHVHLSEQTGENDACFATHGVTPARLLHDTGLLGPRTTAIHATHLTEEDIALLAGTGTGVCLCPSTERDLGDGLGPAHELAAAGVAFSVGTDSNAEIDVLAEARAIELHDRLRLRRRGIHPAGALMDAATVGGMRALGQPIAEPFAVGSPADFVVLSSDNLAMAGFAQDEGVAGVLFRARPDVITHVYVAGDLVVEAGDRGDGSSASRLDDAIRELAP